MMELCAIETQNKAIDTKKAATKMLNIVSIKLPLFSLTERIITGD